MILIVCVDDNNGMMFNKRRQNQDRLVREHIINETKGARLWMNHYSYKQFRETVVDNIVVDDDLLNKAAENDYCFIENISTHQYQHKIDKIILYRWNRRYPADMYFDISLEKLIWKWKDTEEFKGHSHERITKEVYIK